MAKTGYLTIDDAPSTNFLHKLDFLTERGIFAIWFCQGNFLEARPDMAVEAIKRGHWIGNHTYSHPHCSALPVDQVFAEIRATDAVIRDLYKRADVPRPHKLFRFPYGDKGDGRFGDYTAISDSDGQRRRAALQSYLRLLGYRQFPFSDVTYKYYRAFGLLDDIDWYWTYDSHDWALIVDDPPNGIDTPEKVLARMEEDAPEEGRGINTPGSAEILLQHDYADNFDMFRRLIDRYTEKGMVFATPVA